jgi:hypothetical protein
MNLYQVDDLGALFISPAISDWTPLQERGIDTVIDLEGGLDHCVPTVPNQVLYIYFPIFDEDLPNLAKLNAVADLAAQLIRTGHRVLSHCGMGYNRSALVAGLILCRLGLSGPDAVRRLRDRRQGALFNECFAAHLESLAEAAAASWSHGLSEDDHGFRAAFETGALLPAQFDHEAHVRLAYAYLAEHDVEAAVEKVRAALLSFLAHHGIPRDKFHETLTRAWVLAVRHFMNKGASTCAGDFIARNPELLDSKIMLTHYSASLLYSPDAREAFVEPDLDPIPQPGRW